MKTTSLIVACGIAAVLAGCDKAQTPAQAQPTAAPAPAQPAAASPAPAAKTADGTLPRRPDAERAYTLLDLSRQNMPEPVFDALSGQLRDAYWAGAAKDLPALAQDYSPAYRKEQDSFKRADILKELTPQLEAAYAEAQKRKDYAVRVLQTAWVAPYDAQKGGFEVTPLESGEQSTMTLRKSMRDNVNAIWETVFVGTLPAAASFLYKPRDEAEARRVEAALAPQRAHGKDTVRATLQYQGQVLGAAPAKNGYSYRVFLGVDAITLNDGKTGQPLFTIPGSALGPIKTECASTREALNVAEPVITGGGVFGYNGASSGRC
ncbi:hypothetical protein [Bordetella genomosp. 13]|uniref:hypothetical protein n=1 Tax=Bordetella genomosp. 13 TaxID=463040 RepID=UPI0011A63D56|nr:hypothetical protein [Bordetella genomosp. 13]